MFCEITEKLQRTNCLSKRVSAMCFRHQNGNSLVTISFFKIYVFCPGGYLCDFGDETKRSRNDSRVGLKSPHPPQAQPRENEALKLKLFTTAVCTEKGSI